MFINIALILMFASISIYGIVMFTTPKTYQLETDQRLSDSVEELIEKLKTVSREDAKEIITNFCIEYRVAVDLKGENDNLSFGDLSKIQQSTINDTEVSLMTTTTVQFIDSDEKYMFTAAQIGKVDNEMIAIFVRLFPWIILLIIVISILGSYICSRILAKPILKISHISKRMSKLDMTWHCDMNRTDEIGDLANSLNTMAQKLNATMTELETANHQLQLDIEKEKAQEKQRRTFFAAVSHELKTPITILKGQIESMIYNIGDYKNKDKYLPLSLETVERMENMVKEILIISKLTSDSMTLTLLPTDLQILVLECVNAYQPLLLKKNIELDISSLSSTTIDIDKKLFEKVITNIISNAIFYSPIGSKIFVVLNNDIFTVVNTNAHIPEEQIVELFSPLTRVEQSRNTHTGGSGLGLYIVKTILDLHKLPFKIENIDNGVKFSIYF